ncbi:hypothetical protein [Mycobacterium xenopi]|uniref:Uncharacterized protein n=1 Tax=Mycobacterium xenopi 4042 TaxID=1299334 RepID=X8AFP5_MYCXE|nr:hypothetical protein [Mycobacterium xenopi]EUA30349.1 hypothetical protein I553_4606 [Mycobacterium xenopi 4042]EUA51048.1 hypothetical protein I552_1989 [Mycobacterium xenopi 3993]MDA3638792.1 hypothetical protein [Mycobacterium xenopi]MDA3658797.1 hypothetical protein [Mycobacterium xenopi]MDA3663729.1 hypothetical protein [Mycobacterium xenopi]
MSFADCVVAEVARAAATAAATSDPHLLTLRRDEAIAVVVLPDSRGRKGRHGK